MITRVKLVVIVPDVIIKKIEGIEMTKKDETQTKTDSQYWQDVENKVLDPEYLKSEFAESELQFEVTDAKKNRRDFLKVMGFSFTALPMASCLRIPVKKALPYLNKSETAIPGVANWYATTLDPRLGEHLLVKTREGRPIKIEGNPLSTQYKGGTTAYTQGSLLSLYDQQRKQDPMLNGAKVSFDSLDASLVAGLNKAAEAGKPIYFYTPSISSPSFLKLIKELKAKYKTLEHVVFEPGSAGAIVNANRETFKSGVLPEYRFDKAKLVLSFNADFLGTWISPTEFTKQYTQARDVLENENILRHIQTEPLMTLTGSNADTRITMSSKDEEATALGLVAYIQKKKGVQVLPSGISLPTFNSVLVAKLGEELWANKGQSLVVSGSTNTSMQVMVNVLNELLGNYGKTLTISDNPYYRGADNKKAEASFMAIEAGKAGAVLFWNCNPVHDYYNGKALAKSLKNVEVSACFSQFADETSSLCNHIIPTNYFLETWADYFRSPGTLSFAQPVTQPIFGTRMLGESLLILLGKKDYFKYLKTSTKSDFYSKQSKHITFTSFWDNSVHDGVINLKMNFSNPSFNKNRTSVHFSKLVKSATSVGFDLIAYEKVGMRNGELINNPWLQELPDPVTKVTWDNYVLISPSTAKGLGLKNADVVQVTRKGISFELPVVLQPGMDKNTVAVAIGYGHKVSGKVGTGLGANVSSYTEFVDGDFRFDVTGIKLKAVKKEFRLAQTQTHHSMEGRSIVRETDLDDYVKNNKSGNEETVKIISMWGGHDKKGQQWAMVIDLSKCTGCSGCIVSCNAENNVPVVGKEEVANRREMHWMRIDRYYKGDEQNPEVVHQPVMCQHCDNAPCETVCPVLATVQSSDGLNQQVYNRCVGTRYCANNCPYKVRRFNWFDYPHADPYEKMVLNPDVTVRSRGVMEKCSMCIQRIQEGRLEAKKDDREVKDGDIKLACQQSCPGDAIVFGDLNDSSSKVSRLLNHGRNYRLLEEINVAPRVSYLTKVRNKKDY